MKGRVNIPRPAFILTQSAENFPQARSKRLAHFLILKEEAVFQSIMGLSIDSRFFHRKVVENH